MALIALLLILPTVYLLYVRLNRKKLQAIKKKHPAHSPNFEMYGVLYSDRTLALLSFLSVLSIFNLLTNLYKATHAQATGWVSFLAFIGTFLPIGMYVWWLSRRKKK
jgi:hypothetical protein